MTLKDGEPLDNRPGTGLTSDGIPDIDWIDIPDGRSELEGVDGEVKGVNIVIDVTSFRIARYLVTNRQFDAFVDAFDGYRNRKWLEDIERNPTPSSPEWTEANLPRGTVSWYEALAFCRWLTEEYRKRGLVKEIKRFDYLLNGSGNTRRATEIPITFIHGVQNGTKRDAMPVTAIYMVPVRSVSILTELGRTGHWTC